MNSCENYDMGRKGTQEGKLIQLKEMMQRMTNQ